MMDLEDEDTTLEASTDCVDNVCILPTDTQSTVCTTVQEGLATKHSENSLYMVSTISLVLYDRADMVCLVLYDRADMVRLV